MKKGNVGGVYVETCTEYCESLGLLCSGMYHDDKNACNRGRPGTCDETGGATSDHICVCSKLN